MNPFPLSVIFIVGAFIFAVLIIGIGAVMLQNDSNQRVSKADPFAEANAEYARLQDTLDLEVATFSGGCFWCMEGPFEAQEGVEAAVVGFTGGNVERPTYRQVVSGGTGHRESVRIFYDPDTITYGELLEIYWRQIDPTDSGGQFADRGDMYTTAVYYHSQEQKAEVEKQIDMLNRSGRYEKAIVTEVLPSQEFYPAEDYHQDFYIKSSEYYKNYAKGSGRADYIEAAEQRYADQ